MFSKPRLQTSTLKTRFTLLCSAALLLPFSSNAQEVTEIVVTGGSQVDLPQIYAGDQVARGGRVGILGNLDMMDTPFTSTNFTESLVREQQADSVADVLQNDPVVRVAKGFGNFQELYVIRGFPVYSDDMTYNGLYGILPRQYVAAELLERVEVFRGASSFLNGAAPGGSGIGGAVNLVPKRAPTEPLTRITAGLENDDQGYLALDLGRRLGSNDSTGIRVNAVRRDGETSIERQDRSLDVLSAGIDYKGERLRLSADAGYQDHHIDSPRPSVTPLGDIPAAPDADSNFAQNWTYTDERQIFGVARAEYDLTANTTLWAAAGMREGEEDNVLSNPNAMADGSTSAYRFDNTREDEVTSADIGLRSDFSTGNIGHRVILSASRFSLESRNAYAFSSFAGFAGDLYQPFDVTPPAADFFIGGALNDPLITEETETSSVAIADMLSLLDDRILLTVGARLQTIETRTFDYNSGAALSSYDEDQVTPVFGLVYKPSQTLSLYGNYIQGLVSGEVAPATSGGVAIINAGEVFDPYQAEQIEIGAKYDGGSFGGSLSAFTTAMPSSYVEGNVFVDDGEQQNRGIEFSVFGQLQENIRLIGGATLLETEMTETQNGVFEGNEAVGAPDTQVNINLEWDIPALPGLTIDARGIYTSAQYADAANSISVPSWTRYDLGARYTAAFNESQLTLRARVENLADDSDWVSVGGFPGSNYLVLGTGRTLVISASVDF